MYIKEKKRTLSNRQERMEQCPFPVCKKGDTMYTFEDLKEIMATLRSENGCPWDRAQTHESMKKHLVEECAEVLEAIDSQDTENLCEELGDVLYQIMIHAEIEREKGMFTVDDVVDGICKKMVTRHPRVFGNDEIQAEGDENDLWEEMKRREREGRAKTCKNA